MFDSLLHFHFEIESSTWGAEGRETPLQNILQLISRDVLWMNKLRNDLIRQFNVCHRTHL